MPKSFSNWKEVLLEDVCEEITVGYVGSMAKEYVDEGIPFLRSQNVKSFRLDLSDVKFISHKFHQRLRKSALFPGDLVIVRTGYPGTSCVIPESLIKANCADMVIVRSSGQVDAQYLSAIFNSSWGRISIHGRLVGVAQQHFNVSAAKKMRIRLPPIEIQYRISAVITALNILIENNRCRIKILEEMARALYRQWFVHFRFPEHKAVEMVDSELGEIPEGWKTGQLGDIAEEVRRNTDPSDLPSDTPYVGLAEIPRKSIALHEWGEASDAGSSKLQFKKGEILFGKIRPYFHKVVVAPVDGICSGDTIVIVPKTSNMFALTLSVVNSDYFVAHATASSKGTKMPRADWEVLAKYPVVVPETCILERFNSLVEKSVELIHTLISISRNLRQTRNLLLPRLVSGKINVSELDFVTLAGNHPTSIYEEEQSTPNQWLDGDDNDV